MESNHWPERKEVEKIYMKDYLFKKNARNMVHNVEKEKSIILDELFKEL